MKSFNLNFHHKLDNKLTEIKSEYAARERIQSKSLSKFGNESIKKNNYLKEQINKNVDIDKMKTLKYVESSNVSSDSFDNSNKKFQEINQNKRIDSLSLLKDKNNEFNHDINSITSKDKNNASKSNNNVNNKIYMPPKRKTIEDNNNNDSNYNKRIYLRPSFKMSNLEEIVKSQKLNKYDSRKRIFREGI